MRNIKKGQKSKSIIQKFLAYYSKETIYLELNPQRLLGLIRENTKKHYVSSECKGTGSGRFWRWEC